MSVADQVQARFSPQEDSLKWDLMYAGETESVFDEFFRLRRNYALSYITATYRTDAEVCDLGCGAGPVVAELLRRGYDAVGFDYSVDMLQNAARRVGQSTGDRRPLARTDIQALPLRSESFDCAVCLGVISYVEHYEAGLAEIRRILKPGGTAIITYRNEKNLMVSDPAGPMRYLVKKLLRATGTTRKPFRIGDHMSFSEVRDAVARSGLVIETFKGIGFGPLRFNNRPFLSERTSLKLHRTLTRWLERFDAELPFRIGADIHILVVRKPAE